MNKERLLSIMNLAGVDALIASTAENVGYVTGFWQGIQRMVKWVESYAVVSNSDAKPVLAASKYALASGAHFIQPDTLKLNPFGSFGVHGECLVSDIDRRIKAFLEMESDTNAAEALIQTIKEENLHSAVIGIENVIWLPTLERLKKEFPKMRFKEATSLFHCARQVKTPDEIAKLRKAVAIMQRALDVTFQSLSEGMTEREAAGIAKKEVIEQGADPIFMVIEFGANGAHVDTWPTESPLKRGDLVHTDCVCLYEHYYADTARSVVFGQEPTEKQLKYFEAVVQAEKRGVECIKPGVRASEVFSIMDATLRQGIPQAKRFNVGHSIGLEVWEPPLLAPGDDTILEKDMVINIEPPYSEFGFGGLQVEDTLLITADGNEMLTRLDESLKI